jgi:predicted CxxxxCH...CXXCH cytochrome family protein
MIQTRYIQIRLNAIKLTSIIAVMMAVAVFFCGCSSDKNPPTLPGAHPAAWINPESEDFHGRFVLADGTSSCSRCHGIDEPGGRVGVSCTDCHGPGTGGCLVCHGGLDNITSAPPYGLRGENAVTDLAVGAHTKHLDTTSLGAPVPCTACHVVPAYLLSPSHLDMERPTGAPVDSIAEVVWHGFADGGSATWDRNTGTCSGTYCHGAFPGGAAGNAPVWTGTNQADCGSCHDDGSTPARLLWKHEYHVTTGGLSCGDCHASVVDMQSNITTPALHVNGIIDTLTRDPEVCVTCHGPGQDTCIRCHGGTDNTTGAPPLGLEGETSTNQMAVGAHSIHIEGGTMADAFDCRECHIVPQSMLDSGHLGTDEIAEVTWGPLAGGASLWTRASATCSGTYCHGNFSGGDSGNIPVWTAANQADCGSCHDVGSEPESLSGMHKKHISDENYDCIECHSTVVSRQLVIVNTTAHVDGIKTVFLLKSGTYQNGSCSGLPASDCHGTERWYDTD